MLVSYFEFSRTPCLIKCCRRWARIILNSEFGLRPPAHRGHKGLRPGGNAELKKEAIRY